jgi:hypothetical protein
MRVAVTIAVLLAVVATALVAVCQQREMRRLQHDVWQLERRKERVERGRRGLAAAVEATRTPRHLLSEHHEAAGPVDGEDAR